MKNAKPSADNQSDERAMNSRKIFKAEIANLITSGDSITELENGWIKNIIKFNAGQHECTLKINSDAIKNILHITSFSTVNASCGQLEIEGIESLEQGKEITSDICWLLSFATMSKITWLTCEYEGTSQSISTSGFYNRYRPVIEYEAPKAISNFIEKSWDSYKENKDKRNLPAIFDYLLNCDKPAQPLELKLLFCFISLESLKSTYARTKEYKDDGSGFLNPESAKDKCKDGGKCIKRYLSLEKLLLEMFLEQNMKPDLKEIKKLRNEVIHEGLSSKDLSHLIGTYDYMQDILREYLLNLMKFEGRYRIYSEACRKTKEIIHTS